MMAVVLLTAVLSVQFERFVRRQQSPEHITKNIAQLVRFRDEVAALLEVEDIETLHELLQENPNYKHQLLIFDEFDNEIFDRERLLLPAMQKRFNYDLNQEFSRRGLPLSTTILSYQGRVFYIDVQPSILFQPLFSPRFAGSVLRILLLVLFSGLVCYWLTRAFTRRIRQLQEATRHLSVGNYQQAFPDTIRFANDELGQLGKDFQQMAYRLEQNTQARKQMLSDISHELRSPLARMQVALEIARDRFPQAEGQIARVEKESQRMNELIAQIITIQKLAIDEVENAESVDLLVVLKAVIEDVQYEYQNTDKSIQLKAAFDKAITRGASTQLHSAFENLLRNAMSHTAEHSQVSVHLGKENQHWYVHIDDCGSGVGNGDLQKIFQPFVRLDSSRNRHTGGYGLGLSIAKAIIDNHQGQIKAENRSTVSGLSVQVYLPINYKKQ